MRKSQLAAKWMIGIGVIHISLFLWLGSGLVTGVLAEGVWNTIDSSKGRQVVFWALLTGIFCILLGHLSLWLARQGRALPSFLGWELLSVTLVSGFLMPVSGAWLLAVPAILILFPERTPG